MVKEDGKIETFSSRGQTHQDCFETLTKLCSVSPKEITEVKYSFKNTILRSINFIVLPEDAESCFKAISPENSSLISIHSFIKTFDMEFLHKRIGKVGRIPLYYVVTKIESTNDVTSPKKKDNEIFKLKVEKFYYELCSVDSGLDYNNMKEKFFPLSLDPLKMNKQREFKYYSQRFFLGLATILQNHNSTVKDFVSKEVLSKTLNLTDMLKEMTFDDREKVESLLKVILQYVSKLTEEKQAILSQFEKLSLSTQENAPVKTDVPYKLEITEYIVGKPVLYKLNVTSQDGSYDLMKRYSEFNDFSAELKKITHKFKFPPFPEKIFIGNTQESKLEERKNMLNVYLDAVSEVKDFYTHPMFKKFIKKEESLQ